MESYEHRDHMALHDPSFRTQCPGCDKVYMHSRTCNDHAKKAHGMDLKTLSELRAATHLSREEEQGTVIARVS